MNRMKIKIKSMMNKIKINKKDRRMKGSLKEQLLKRQRNKKRKL